MEILLNVPEILSEVENVRQLYFQPVEVEFLGWNRDDYFMTRDEMVEFQEQYQKSVNVTALKQTSTNRTSTLYSLNLFHFVNILFSDISRSTTKAL